MCSLNNSSALQEVQRETGILGDITAVQLRYFIDEIYLQIQMLERSNDELKMELKQGFDADYEEAISENVFVMHRMKAKILRYLEILRQIDPAYAQEHQADLTMIFTSLQLANVNSIGSAEILADAAYNRGSEVIEIVVDGRRQVATERRILESSNGVDACRGLYL